MGRVTSALQTAMRKKFGTPEKALEALGLPSNLLAADGAPAQGKSATMTKLSAMASAARAALTAHFIPLLAADAAIDLTPAVAGVTKKNYAAMRPQMLAKAKEAAEKAGVAMDQVGPDDVMMRILDMAGAGAGAEEPDPAAVAGAPDPAMAEADQTQDINGGEVGGGMTTEPNGAAAPAAAAEGGEGAPDPEKMKALMAKLGGDAEMAKACYDICMGPAKDTAPPAQAETPEHKTEAEVGKDKKAKDEAEMMPVTQTAMDAAIAASSQRVREQMRAEAKAAQEARAHVRPKVGEISLAFDTAESVYEAALKSLGVKTQGVHASAFRALFDAVPAPGSAKPKFANDSRPGGKASSAAKRHPHAAGIRVL